MKISREVQVWLKLDEAFGCLREDFGTVCFNNDTKSP